MQNAPRTMTLSGLKFLEALAAERRTGSFLEIGPLFGSSTNAIAAGRADPDVPIHTIDTFEPAPWVKKRLGIDLSRDAFDHYTNHIENLTVHQGFAPDIVRPSWTDTIGFYFDDATHGDPGWSQNYNFFSPFFADDAIVCGDDFAGGWPDIVRNVYDITTRANLNLFVIGRVWAFTRRGEERIENAVHRAFPKLRSCDWEVLSAGKTHRNVAATWSWGLHRDDPIDEAILHSKSGLGFDIQVERHDGSRRTYTGGQEPIVLSKAKTMRFSLPENFSLQFCVKDKRGRSENTRDLHSGSELVLSEDQKITSLRLSHR